MTPTALRIRRYPSRLSVDDIDDLQALAFRGWNVAPEFCHWLVMALQAEQLRRLHGEAVERFELPSNCTNKFLAGALMVTAAMDVGVQTAAAQRFLDSLKLAVIATTAARLERT